MIQLIKNEFKKNFTYSHYIFSMLITFSILFIFHYSKNISSFINTIYYIIPFIGIVITLTSSSIISKEYTSGTFKNYLTKPYKRWKIIISKIIYLIILSIYYQLLTIAIYSIIVLLTKNISNIPNLSTIIRKYLLYSIPIYFIIIFSLLLSTIFKNSKISSSLSALLLVTGNIISNLLFTIKWTFIQYTFLPYLDFTIFLDKNNINTINEIYNLNLSLKNGILVLSVYTIISLILTIYIFNKRDINA